MKKVFSTWALGAVLIVVGCQGPKGDTGDQGPQGLQGNVGPAGPAGAPAPGGNNLMRWAPDLTAWTFASGTAAAITLDADAVEGDSSFNFAVTSGTTGSAYSFGDFIPIDPNRIYEGRVWAKLVAGAGSFSAGVATYNGNKALIPATVAFISDSTTLTNGAWTELVGTVGGEGGGPGQFPAGTRFVKPFVTVNTSNVGTTRVDGFAIYPVPIRTIARWQGYSDDQQDNGVLTGRTVVFRKRASATGLRVVWSDNFRVAGTGATMCRWEVLFNGASCTSPGGLFADLYEGVSSDNTHQSSTFVGTCFGIPAGQVTVNTRVGPHPQRTAGDCYTGHLGQLVSLEVEEVL